MQSSINIDKKINNYVLKLSELLVELHKNGQYVGVMHPKNIKYANEKFLFQREKTEEEVFYLAPEQFHVFKNNKTEKSDLYSFGVLLYYMYTQTYPVIVRDNQSWIEAHLWNEVPPIELLNGRLNKVIMKLLHKNPQKRYNSALGLFYELKAVLGEAMQDHHEFEVGSIDDRLLDIDRLTYPLHISILNTFNSFISNKLKSSHILTISGQNQLIRRQVLSELTILFDSNKNTIFSIDSMMSKETKKDILTQLVEQYITLIASYSPAHLGVILNQILSEYKHNATEILGRIPQLLVLVNKFQLHFGDGIEVKSIKVDGETEPIELEMILPLLKVIHQYIKNTVYWVVSGETKINTRQLDQIISLKNDLGAQVKLILSHELSMYVNTEHSVTELNLEQLNYEDISSLLTKLMMEDSAQLRILAQSLLYTSQGDFQKIKEQLLHWVRERLIYFQEDTYEWTWDHSLIENQSFTEQLIDYIKGELEQLDKEALKIIAVAALIDNRVNDLLLAKLCEKNVLYIQGAMNDAEKLGIVFNDKRENNNQSEYMEYVFLNDELRKYLQYINGDDQEKWHYKIGTVLASTFNHLMLNGEHLSLHHLNLAHRKLNKEELEQVIMKNLIYGTDHFYHTNDFIKARNYFVIGKNLCEIYGEKYNPFLYKFILYLATTEYLCHNEDVAKQLFKELNPYVSKMEINDRRHYYIWQMEIYAFENEELCLKFGTAALNLFDLHIPSKVSVTTVIKEIIVTQRLLKNFRLGKLPTKSNNTTEFRLMCRTVYGISSVVATSNPLGLIYFYSKFLQANLLEGMNNELALLVSMFELMIQRGASFLYKLIPTDAFEYIIAKENYSSAHFFMVKAILTQIDKPQDVYPFLTLAMSKAIEDNNYRSVNFALLAIIVMFNEDITKIEVIINFVKTDIHISLDVNLQELVDEFTYYYDANQFPKKLNDYINVNYEVNKRHINYISMNRMEMAYVARHYERVQYWYDHASQTMIDVNWVQNRKILLYKHLAMAALFYKTDDKKMKREYVKQLKLFINKMKKWDGYLGKESSVYYLVCAEYEAMLEHAVKAQSLYEKAINCARMEKNARFEALALECLAHYFTRRGSETGRMIAIMDAITAYTSYGMHSKVEMLRNEVKLPLEIYEEKKSKGIEHQLYETAVTDSIDHILAKSERQLSDIYTIQGHWKNQLFIDSFVTLACRQVTASFGFLIKYSDEGHTLLSQYGSNQLINHVLTLKPILNYCANIQDTFVYNQYSLQCLNIGLDDIQSLICIPINLLNHEDTYILAVGSEFLNYLFNAQEKLILELLLSRFIYLAEQGKVTSKQVSSYLQSSVQASVFTTLIEPLTEREVSVLREIVNGLSNDEISKQLDIKLATVKTHINNIYSKLGVKRRAQAIIKATEMNLV